MEKSEPDYKRIYTDLVNAKYANKKEVSASILSKKKLSVLDVITLNKILFNNEIKDKETSDFDQNHRAYDRQAIFEILDYQKKWKYTNSQLALHFKVSRNTITKWKRIYLR
ncbi:helix-turn-helix domain-containing protein [Chryseobacterium sp. SIMBA_038]|uniref:helix-turn-helix domain-containing protein n=1 Tax=Chryseobacterium sp. SIMBA_038 TaxID=3085780 RepID=UPI003977F463